MKIKRFTAIFTAFLIIISSLCSFSASALLFNPGISLQSEAVYMINLDRDVTVYEKNSDKKMYPASLTKIMTAIVVLDNIDPDKMDSTYFEAPLAVFDDLYQTGALTVGYSKGEKVSVSDLMYSMLVYSACESAGILAYNVGGESIPNFVDMMNKKAEDIGCVGTHFVNPHGLHDRNQYTNAADMAKIAKYAVENYPEFKKIACTEEYTLGATNMHEDGWMTITHSNKMMNPASEYYYEYAMGIKTGTTDESGRNLISMAQKDGSTYLLVTMGAPLYDDEGYNSYGNFEDQIKLYDWAFNTLAYQQIIPADKEITEVTVNMGSGTDFVRLVTAESKSMLWSKEIDVGKLGQVITTEGFTNEDGTVTAPVEKGQKLGTYTLTLNGEEIASVDLVAQESVSLSIMEYNAYKAKQFFGSGWFKAAVVIALMLVAAYVTAVVMSGRKKKRRLKRVNKRRKF